MYIKPVIQTKGLEQREGGIYHPPWLERYLILNGNAPSFVEEYPEGISDGSFLHFSAHTRTT